MPGGVMDGGKVSLLLLMLTEMEPYRFLALVGCNIHFFFPFNCFVP